MRFTYSISCACIFLALSGCSRGEPGRAKESAVRTSDASTLGSGNAPKASAPHRLKNRIAYVPPQCFAKTKGVGNGSARNTCYPCHVHSAAPNYTNDEDLQLSLTLPAPAAKNPWANLFDPPVSHAPPIASNDVLAYVRRSNYFDEAHGAITIANSLAPVRPEWDTNHNGSWDGFIPDAWFSFDDRGFDHRPDGSFTGWRAFAYYPVPGAFLPTNGSADDVLIRLDSRLREDASGTFDPRVYEINLAIVEALIRRVDVKIDPADETALGVDLDLDGTLGKATRVTFDEAPDGTTKMHYVGRAHVEEQKGKYPIYPGMFPTGTELFHTVRYLDIAPDGSVAMAARMKEVRYAKKTQWSSAAIARANAAKEARETQESTDGVHDVRFQSELGTYSARGWLLQGFIETEDGALRPQTYEESATCAGCHGGIGGTVDSTFSFARKISGENALAGWFHWSQKSLRGIKEPKRKDGEYEYSLYLKEAQGGDDYVANDEVRARFFDEQLNLKPAALASLHSDISELLLPSPERAIALDRAYLAIVEAQSFDKGRDVVLAAIDNAVRDVTIGSSTGVVRPVAYSPLAPPSWRSKTRASHGPRP